MITRFGDRLGVLTLPVSAFVGGVCSAIAVMLLFHFKKQRGAEHLILCGLAISFLFGALTSYFIFRAISEPPAQCFSGHWVAWD